MRLLLIAAIVFLSGCTASIPSVQEVKSAVLLPPGETEEEVLVGSGRTFIGNLSTNGALNSRRTFISEYHGEVSLVVLPNKKIDCRFWVEGRITDTTVYDGPNGFIESFSTLCTGKLQKDGTFEFQGAMILEGPGEQSPEDEEHTFTMKGEIQNDEIVGDIIIGGLFRNAVVLSDPKTIIDTGEGLRFIAAKLP
ncbi:hypothetical protein COU75_03005 [Candidatus Peregrinibacteria bacterium CG10_big_fil_rev_8_21_14_0_10_42_8]|nr:MAG: hypothetical protein COU75_03005 [Candidatus Peregrinibacteria bacterium CG10_big_fil_rev_8_21_14_0_10_42_8]